MTGLIGWRRCGSLFVHERFTIVPHEWRLCPRRRGFLPPTGGVSMVDEGSLRPRLTEAVA